MAEHLACDKTQVIEMIVDGQAAIFNKLDGIRDILEGVAVQKIEIDHIKLDVDKIKTEMAFITQRCGENHVKIPQSTMTKAINAAIVGVVASAAICLFWFTAYIAYINLPGFFTARNNPSSIATGEKK